jgi:predicted metalloendopeptidase
MDATAEPCEDFFQFSCGNWLKNNGIPEELSSFGTLDLITEAVDFAVKGNIQQYNCR